MNKLTAEFLIKTLSLSRHPEGGYYKEVYRSKNIIPGDALYSIGSERNYFTSIYYLLSGEDFSAFHKIHQEETWHFYSGCPILLHLLGNEKSEMIKLGPDPSMKQLFQFTVPADTWFAAELENKKSHALVGCTVAPGFDFDDFTLGAREELLSSFPENNKLIHRLTRN